MTFSRLAGCAAILVGTFLAASTPHPVPFTIEASEDVSARFPGAPRLQSFAWGEWAGKWIFIAGRTTGYHGVGGQEADFPRSGANDKIWIVEPSTTGIARTWSVPLRKLPASFGEVKEGSVVTLDFVDGATRIGQDGTAKGSIQGEAFNRALTRIWLGDRPVQADLKKAMLGGS